MPGPSPSRPASTEPRSLVALATRLGLPAFGHDVAVTGVTHDSHGVRPGDLYAALPGAKTHGIQFVADAAGSGAVAVLTDEKSRLRAEQANLPVLVAADPRAVLGPVAAFVYGEPTDRL